MKQRREQEAKREAEEHIRSQNIIEVEREEIRQYQQKEEMLKKQDEERLKLKRKTEEDELLFKKKKQKEQYEANLKSGDMYDRVYEIQRPLLEKMSYDDIVELRKELVVTINMMVEENQKNSGNKQIQQRNKPEIQQRRILKNMIDDIVPLKEDEKNALNYNMDK